MDILCASLPQVITPSGVAQTRDFARVHIASAGTGHSPQNPGKKTLFKDLDAAAACYSAGGGVKGDLSRGNSISPKAFNSDASWLSSATSANA